MNKYKQTTIGGRGGRRVNFHVGIAERVLGKRLPHGAQVHHVDENKRNNAHSNLVICQDQAYHALLHVRARIVRAGGNPNTQAICSYCKALKLKSDFSAKAAAVNGVTGYCRACCSVWRKSYDRPSQSKAAKALRLRTKRVAQKTVFNLPQGSWFTVAVIQYAQAYQLRGMQ